MHQTNGCITIQTARANIGNSQIKLPTTPYTFHIILSEDQIAQSCVLFVIDRPKLPSSIRRCRKPYRKVLYYCAAVTRACRLSAVCLC